MGRRSFLLGVLVLVGVESRRRRLGECSCECHGDGAYLFDGEASNDNSCQEDFGADAFGYLDTCCMGTATGECCETECVDDDAWIFDHTRGGTKGCAVLARRPELCGKKSAARVLGYEACPRACGLCEATDSTSWFANGKPKNSCGWIAKNPGDRCGKKDGDRVPATYACPEACGDGATHTADSCVADFGDELSDALCDGGDDDAEACYDDPKGILQADGTSCDMELMQFGCDDHDADYEGYAADYWQLCPASCGRCDDYAAPTCHDEDACCCEDACEPLGGSYCMEYESSFHNMDGGGMDGASFGSWQACAAACADQDGCHSGYYYEPDDYCYFFGVAGYADYCTMMDCGDSCVAFGCGGGDDYSYGYGSYDYGSYDYGGNHSGN